MKRERLLAMLLFSGAALLVWLGFAAFYAEPGTRSWLLVGGGVAGVLAAATVSAWLAPTLAAEAKSGAKLWRGAVLGAFVTFASYVLGVVILAVGTTVVALVVDPAYTAARAGEGTFLIAFVGLATAVTYLSPGFIIGGVAGAVFYRIAQSSQPPAT